MEEKLAVVVNSLQILTDITWGGKPWIRKWFMDTLLYDGVVATSEKKKKNTWGWKLRSQQNHVQASAWL